MYNTVAGTPTVSIGELADDGTSQIESTTSGNAGGVAANFAIGSLNTSTTYGGSIIDATVGIIKVGTGTLTLTNATLTYGGQTTVSNGVLVLGASVTLPNSTPINMGPSGTLDVSAFGTLNLAAAQTLQGSGTLDGSVAVAGTVSPGGANSIGTLTVTNDANITGTLLMELNKTNSPTTNDMLVAQTIEVSGTLTVNNIGSDVQVGDTYKLLSVPATGTFTATNLPAFTSNGSPIVWTNKLGIDGTIQVLSITEVAPTTNANITKVLLSGTNVVVIGTNNNVPNTSFHYVALTSTNIAIPLSNWVPVVTNGFNPDGTFDYTNPIVPGTPRQFIDIKAVL
jgi:autotransporter-associated beta strand protein